MSNQSLKVGIPELIIAENEAIMINMENSLATIRELLEIIKDLESRVSDLDGK